MYMKVLKSALMNRGKIFNIITRLNNGGAAKCAIWLSGMLDKKKFDTILISGKTEGNEDDILWYSKHYAVLPVIISQMKRSLNPFSDLIALLKIYRLILKENPVIIHTHMSKAGLLGRAAAIFYNRFHKKKIKIIHTFHGHVFHSYFSGIKTRLVVFLENMLARRTDIIISISDRLNDEIRQKINIKDSDKLRVIPLGVDYSPSKRHLDRKSRKRDIHIGMLGRLAPVKNYRLAFDIAGILLREKIPVKILIGGGGSKKDFKKLQPFPMDNIFLLGNIDNASHFWNEIDVAMVTSKNEGTPVSLIEAMLTHIPFIAPEVGGIPDMTAGSMTKRGNLLIYDNCILIQGFNPEDFVNAIRIICDSKYRKRSGDSAEKYAKEKYSIFRMINGMEALYKEVMEYE